LKKYIAIIGSGSFVFEDQYGEGVILRSILQYEKLYGKKDIILFYHNKNKIKGLQDKLDSLKADSVQICHTTQLNNFIDKSSICATFICVPDIHHFEYAKKMIENKIPTWIVKPLTDNLTQAKQLKLLSKQNNTILWIDYHKRFDNTSRLLKNYVRNNSYGDLLQYSIQYTQPIDLPQNTFLWAKDTNVMSYIGCHYIDQIEFLYGKEIKAYKITSIGTKGLIYKKNKNNCYDSIVTTLIVYLNNGKEIVCNFQIGWCDPLGTPSKSHQRVEAIFEKGRLIMDQKERGVQLWDENKLHFINPYFFTKTYEPTTDKELYSGYGYDSIKFFLNYVNSSDTIKYSTALPFIENTMFTEYVLESSILSLKTNGQWVKGEINDK